MDHFISQYIDEELSLDEKILFFEYAHGNRAYTDKAVSLLRQKKPLCSVLVKEAPEFPLSQARPSSVPRLLGLVVAACLLLVLSFFLPVIFNFPTP